MSSNLGILQDSYWGFTPEKDGYLDFYQLNNHYTHEFKRIDSTLFKYSFTEDTVYSEYTRTKYNLLDILTELGGLFSSFFLIGNVFTISFSYNLFLSSIIRVIYHFPARFESELTDKEAKKKKKK